MHTLRDDRNKQGRLLLRLPSRRQSLRRCKFELPFAPHPCPSLPVFLMTYDCSPQNTRSRSTTPTPSSSIAPHPDHASNMAWSGQSIPTQAPRSPRNKNWLVGARICSIQANRFHPKRRYLPTYQAQLPSPSFQSNRSMDYQQVLLQVSPSALCLLSCSVLAYSFAGAGREHSKTK